MSQNTGVAPMYSTTFGRRDPGERRDDHLVARAQAERRDRDVQRRRARLVATACGAPVKVANCLRTALTYGPCTTQPLSSGAVNASRSSAPNTGLVIGNCHSL